MNIPHDAKVIDIEDEVPTTPLPTHRETAQPERTRLIIFGVVKIQRTRLLATLSGLKVRLSVGISKKKKKKNKILFGTFSSTIA